MTNEELKAYVFEERRQGRSDSQIARGLGMSLKHLIGKLNGVDVEKIDPPKAAKPEKKTEVKPASGAKQPEEEDVKLDFVPGIKDLGDGKIEVGIAYEAEPSETATE